MPSRDYAAILMRKAQQDEYVARLLADDPDSPDEAIGFHAQQAVEKILKAVLAHQGIRFRWRHDLVQLIDLMRDAGVDVPDGLDDVRRLTPFATEFRYDELPPEHAEPLDRKWALDCIVRAREWAHSFLE